MKKIRVTFLRDKLTSNSQKAITLAKTKSLGEFRNNIVFYSPFEAFYLIEKNSAEVTQNNKQLTKEETETKLSKKDKKFHSKYLIFKKLKEKGYTIKTALKFGSDFRVYEKNSKHAKWLVYALNENEKVNLKEFISKNRIAHQSAKKILISIVDSEENILFYEINWINLK